MDTFAFCIWALLLCCMGLVTLALSALMERTWTHKVEVTNGYTNEDIHNLCRCCPDLDKCDDFDCPYDWADFAL